MTEASGYEYKISGYLTYIESSYM